MNTASEVIASAHGAFGVIPCPVPAAAGAATAAPNPVGSSGWPNWVAGSFMAGDGPSHRRTEAVSAGVHGSRRSPAPRIAATSVVEARRKQHQFSPVPKVPRADLLPIAEPRYSCG